MSDIYFAEIDAREIWSRMLARFEAAFSDTLEASDERRIFLQQELQIIVGLYNSLNFAGRMTLLRYAYGEYLDAIGEDRDVNRLTATKAETTLRFSLQEARQNSVLIPAGTRATTADDNLTFETLGPITIPAGAMYADAAASATMEGDTGNGVAVGMITIIVDPIPYVASVTNITISAGGADTESDEAYKERIRLAWAQTGTAGAEESYKYWAVSANPDIADVSVLSPSPGEVLVVPLLKGGTIPDQEVLESVYKALNAKEVRPLTDHVTVQAPTIDTFTIDFDYYAPLAQSGTVRQNVETTGGAVDQYVEWQTAVLNRPLNPDYLRKLLFDAGATRITIRQPEFKTSNNTQVFSEDIGQRNMNFIVEEDEP